MHLTITRFLDISPETAHERLPRATAATLAPERAEVRISGIDRLATVEVIVPWSADRREATALAADRYATALTTELAAA
ncbi:MAG: hypothetical protein AAF548_18365 [Actinomycetota bacterium]